jgi:hypothetical protein
LLWSKKALPDGGAFLLKKQGKLSFLEHWKPSSLVFGRLVSIWESIESIIFFFASKVIDLLFASSAEGNHLSVKEVGLTFAVCD